MAAANQLRSLKEEATCSICLGYFTDPVSVECGHVFCLSCISRYWEGLQTDFSCPQCRVLLENKTLRPNRQLANVVEIAKQLHRLGVTPEGENLCREHEEKLKLFCEDDQEPICVICRESRDHKAHSARPIREAALEYKKTLHSHMERLKKELECLQTWTAEESMTEVKLEENFENQRKRIRSTFELLKLCLAKEEEQLLNKLEKDHEECMQKIREQLAKLEKQKSVHRGLITEIDGKCQQQDVEVLKGLQSILSRCDNVKALKPKADDVVKKILQSVGQHGPLHEKLLELKATFLAELDWRCIKSCSCDVILDPDTAHRYLVVSEDRKSVRRARREQDPPDMPERFTRYITVLGKESLSSGKHYWEVEVGDKTGWDLGVCDESVSRKGKSRLSPENGFWTVWFKNGEYKALISPLTTILKPQVPLRVVGLLLDYEAGRFSVYNVQDRSLLFTFSEAFFPCPLRPLFSPHPNYEGEKAGELQLLTVTELE
ncbi:E3 ubiquitin-protein ligase TRIM39-like [Lissotriton helveticus]